MWARLFGAEGFLGFGDAGALFAVDADLALLDFINDDFQVTAAVAFNHGACALDEFDPAVLDQGAELKAAAHLVDNFIALECFDHAYSKKRMLGLTVGAAEFFGGGLDFLDGHFDAVVLVDDFELVDSAGVGCANFLFGFSESSLNSSLILAAPITQPL